MKKFLSLVLALVMTMSLVTISAGATEYKDLTDKSEIKYAEAVAVLNKVGVITGYEDGSFKPANNLTRGAAAKIIVSLMIGPEAASSLTVNANPYKDVKATDTFAPYIAYCKTAGYISGYSDGSFRAGDPLTGYAFAKMLLGAVGYSSKVEGFTGSGWTMNVARLANKAGLLNGISGFSGNTAVTREAACQLALNTLKATNVEYVGNTVNVSGENINVSVGNNQYSSVYSSNNDINRNIKTGVQTSEGYTLEFGEEHFPNLKLIASSTEDSFGRPSNQWSYKNVTVGTYAKDAALSYTVSASGDTTYDKVKDMGIKDYSVKSGVKVIVNGVVGATINSVNDIPAYTANGTQVLLYTSADTADQITNVVVIKTQMMQVNKVSSTSVTLKRVEDTGSSVATVNDDDAAFKTLKNLKADDYVLVVPVKDGSNTVVDSVSVPTTASGKLTKISTKSNNTAVSGITVGGTDYKMSELWSSEDGNLKPSTTLSTKVDTSVYLDGFGYAIYVKNVTSSNSVIIIDEIYNSLVDGKLIKMAQGWDTTGASVSLNLGTATLPASDKDMQGVAYEYTSTTDSNAEYKLLVGYNTMVKSTGNKVFVPAGSTRLMTNTTGPVYTSQYFDSGVKFVFLSKDTSGNVTGIAVKDGASEVGSSTDASKQYVMQYVLNKEGTKITAVIVPNDNDAAVTANLMYVQKNTGYTNVDGKTHAVFTAFIDGVETTGCLSSKSSSVNSGFYTYSKNDTTGVYTLSSYTQPNAKATSVITNATLTNNKTNIINDTYIVVNDGTNARTLNAKNAIVKDLTGSGSNFESVKDLADSKATDFTVSLVYNDSTGAGSGTVSYLFVLSAKGTSGGGTVNMTDYAVEIGAGNVIDVSYYTGKANDDVSILTAIQTYLGEQGYTELAVSYANPTYTINAKKGNITIPFTWDTSDKVESVKINLNGEAVLAAKTLNLTTLSATVTDHGTATFVKVNGTMVAKDTTAIVDGNSYETGFVKVTGTASAITGTTDGMYKYAADVTAGTAEWNDGIAGFYAKKNAELTITFVLDTKFALTAKKDTITVSADANATVTPASVVFFGTDVAGTNQSVTVKVDGAGNVAVSFAGVNAPNP